MSNGVGIVNDHLRDYYHRVNSAVQGVAGNRPSTAAEAVVPHRMAPARQRPLPDEFISVTSRKYR